MKTFKLTFALILLVISSGFSQSYFYWQGGSGSFIEPSNWVGNVLPSNADDVYIVFDTGDIITVSDFPDSFTIGGMEILNDPDNGNSTRVSFTPMSVFAADSIHNLLIESGCLMAFHNDPIEIYVENAEIYGDVSFNNAAHRLSTLINDGINRIIFYQGSTFISGDFQIGHPFGSTNFFSVMFLDGSVYQHHGGASPFGLETNLFNPITEFGLESDFEIFNNNSLQFRGRKYGNIIVKTAAGVQYFASAGAEYVSFQFTDLIVETGFFNFIGDLHDKIDIKGDTISSEGGEIYLQTGDEGITISNSVNPVIVKGANPIIIKTNSSLDLDLNFVDINTELVLETNIGLEAEIGNGVNYWVHGTIDCNDKEINFVNNSEIILAPNALLRSSHTLGALGNISNLYILNDANIEYYGAVQNQNAGLPPYVIFNEMMINKFDGTSVLLNETCETNLMSLNSGNFHINDQTLRISGNIYYSNGLLLGNSDLSRLEFVEVDGNTSNILLKTPLSLSDLVLSITGNLILTDNDLLIVNDSLDLYSGKLNISNSHLRLGENIVITSIDEDISYIIAENEGYVKMNCIPGNISRIPIGTSSYSSGLTINPNATAEYSFKVFDHVYAEGYTGYIYENDILDMTWVIYNESGTDTQADISFFWKETSSMILPGFNHTNAFISNFDILGQKWDNPGVTTPSVVGGVSRTTDLSGFFCVSSTILNNVPSAIDQEFIILEHSPNDTEIGYLQARDDDGQILSFYVLENHTNPDAFNFFEDGRITVKNSDLLEFSLNPTFEYTIDVCDDGSPMLCSQFNIIIKLREVFDNIIITNFISPNNDNYNDTWKIVGLEPADINVLILNQTGNKVYESEAYRNDWNGTVNGRRLPSGVYYYIVRTPNSEYKGTITLVR